MAEFLTNHQGPKRAWLGQWDHKRGGERTPDGRLELGRESWFDEVFSFLDQHVRGVPPTAQYPALAVEDSTGAWRAEQNWPRADRTTTVQLGGGSYVDDGAASSYVQRSRPVERPTRLTGTPHIAVTAQGSGNLMVRLHDVAPDGKGVIINQQVSALEQGDTALQLKSMDWTLPAGHALAAEIGTIQPGIPITNDWLPTTSGQQVTVQGARLELDLDDPARDVATPGTPAPWAQLYRLSQASAPVGPPTFALP